MMQVLIVPDSFKECLDAQAVAMAIAQGIKNHHPQVKTSTIPFSDGGEGALDLLENHGQGQRVSCPTVDSIGRPITADYILFKNHPTAWIELSQASGLAKLKQSQRNPLVTTTYGTGLQIKDALARGCTKIILGVGGSATNDGGAGIFQALGGRLLDQNHKPLSPGGAALGQLRYLHSPTGLDHIQWQVACDVQNPLLGSRGASRIYAPQKGASTHEVQKLEKSLSHFSKIIKSHYGQSIDRIPGGGAAGGTAAGMLGFFNAQLVSGFNLLAELLHLEEAIKNADLVFTAEGKIDQQSSQGKLTVAVAQMAKKHNTPCVGLAGALEGPLESFYKLGFSGIFSIQQGPISQKESFKHAASLLTQTTERVFAFYHNTLSS